MGNTGIVGHVVEASTVKASTVTVLVARTSPQSALERRSRTSAIIYAATTLVTSGTEVIDSVRSRPALKFRLVHVRPTDPQA